jgi:hypothetical protein
MFLHKVKTVILVLIACVGILLVGSRLAHVSVSKTPVTGWACSL